MASCWGQPPQQTERPSSWTRWTLTSRSTPAKITCSSFVLWLSTMWSTHPVRSMSCQPTLCHSRTSSWLSFWTGWPSPQVLPVRSEPPTSLRRSSGDTASCPSSRAPRWGSTMWISQTFQKVFGSPRHTASTALRRTRTTGNTTTRRRGASTTWASRWSTSTTLWTSQKCERLKKLDLRVKVKGDNWLRVKVFITSCFTARWRMFHLQRQKH